MHGEWRCVPYESDAYVQRSAAIQGSIQLVRGLCEALTARTEESPKTHDLIDLNLQKIIQFLESLD